MTFAICLVAILVLSLMSICIYASVLVLSELFYSLRLIAWQAGLLAALVCSLVGFFWNSAPLWSGCLMFILVNFLGILPVIRLTLAAVCGEQPAPNNWPVSQRYRNILLVACTPSLFFFIAVFAILAR